MPFEGAIPTDAAPAPGFGAAPVTSPASQPEGGVSRAISEFGRNLILAHPINTIRALGSAVAHPLDTLEAMGHQTGDLARKSVAAYNAGDYTGAVVHAVSGALNTVPGMGAAFDEAVTKGRNGDWAGMVGDSAALVGNLLTPSLIKGGAVAVGSGIARGTAALAAKGGRIGRVAEALATPEAVSDIVGIVSPRTAHSIDLGIQVNNALRSSVNTSEAGYNATGVVSPNAAHGLKLLGRIQNAIKSPLKEPPAAPAPEPAAPPPEPVAAAPEAATAPPPSIITPGEAPPPVRPDWRQNMVSALNYEREAQAATPSAAATQPVASPSVTAAPAEDLRAKFLAQAKSQAPVEPAEAPPGHPMEAVNRDKLAKDMAQYLYSGGGGISHADALRMGPDEWTLARTAVRQGYKTATPSPSTVRASLEYLKDIEAKAQAVAEAVGP